MENLKTISLLVQNFICLIKLKKMKKNWIDKAIENSFTQLEKKGNFEKKIITIEMFKKDNIKNFSDIKSIRDILLRRLNFGKR